MALKASTGCRNKLLDTNPFKTIFNLGFIEIYSGAEPASADAAATGTKLAKIGNGGSSTGVTFEAAAANGSIAKKSSETWEGPVLANGTAGYYRLVAAGDDGTLSTTQARLQGSVGTSGADLNLSNLTLSQNGTQGIDYYTVTLPTF